MRSQYTIIFVTLITLVASMLFLSYIENDQRQRNENFWSVYFVDPFSVDNRFIIENRSMADATFFYEITQNDITTRSEDLTVKKGEFKLIVPDEKNKSTPIQITVAKDDERKSIDKK